MRHTSRDDLDWSHGPVNPGRPRDFEANMQCIASTAHRRGVIFTRSQVAIGTTDAAGFCKTLRRAHAAEPEHTAQLAHGIAAAIGPRGSLEVPQSTWNVIKGYALKPPKDAH